MSVNKSDRSKSELATAVKARELACYTIQITSNDKIFLQKYRSALTDKIIADAVNIYRCVWKANNIRVNKSAEAWRRRSVFQQEAKELCDDLLALMGIAKQLFHLTSKRIEYWTGLTIEAKTMIIAWHRKDSDRYKNL